MSMSIRQTLLISSALVGLALAPIALSQRASRAELRFQEAHRKETIDGDLKSAIDLYRKAIGEAGSNRTIAAQSLVRIGECYERLGDTDARKAYERVVREFGDQKESVAAARVRLAALGRAAAPSGMSVRRVFEDLPGGPSAISPDGRYVIHHEDRTTSNYMVRDLTTGKSRRLTSYDKLSNSLSWDPLFSPDSRRIAYATYTGPGQELHVVGVDGAGDRIVWWTTDHYFDLQGWFPDGSRVAVLTYSRNKPFTKRLLAVALADGAVKVLREGASTGWDGWLSPDGKYYAFHKGTGTDPRRTDIWCLSLDNGSETPLFEYPASNLDPRWTPDGKGVIFMSNRLGTRGLWYLPVSAGKPAGPVELIKGDVGERFYPVGSTHDGSVYYSNKVGLMNSLLAEFDPATGKMVSGPSEIAPEFSGHTENAAFSADGQWLAYCRMSRFRGDPYTLVLRSLATGKEREVATPFRRVSAQRWFPDGQSLLVYGDHSKSGRGYYRFEIDTGKSLFLVRTRMTLNALGPDGKALYFVRGHEDGGTGWGELYTIELDPATGKVLTPPAQVANRFLGNNFGAFWSPDRQYLAYVSWRSPLNSSEPGALTYVIKSLKTGEERDLSLKSAASPLRWFPDGKSFLFISREDREGQPAGFHRVNAESGAVHLIRRVGRIDVGPELSPDGKAIFYVQQEPSKAPRILVYRMETEEEEVLFQGTSGQSIGWFLYSSPDGRRLAFVLTDPATNSAAIKIMPASGGEMRELAGGLPNRVMLGGWSPDSRHLYYAEGGQSGGLWRISAEGGQSQKLDVNMKGVRWPTVHPDGRRLGFNAAIPYSALRSRNLETGEEQELLRNDDAWIYPAVSPDGKQLAVARIEGGDSLIEILPLGGGSRREILRLRAAEALLGYLAFSLDGREIFFSRRAPKGERVELWRVPVQGGAPAKTDVWVQQVREQGQDSESGGIVPAPTDYSVQQFRGLAFHPDGRRFVFDAGSERHEFWAMENFLPKAAK
jgi:Tol biopolymer transport system component